MYGNYRFFIVTHRGALSLRTATKKLEHYQRHHTTETLDGGHRWCDRCALILTEEDDARYGRS